MGSSHITQKSEVPPASSDQEEAHGASLPRRIPPGGGTWFRAEIGATKGPQERMFEHARMHNHKFRAAFDYIPFGYNRVVKMFASFPSWEDFVTGTLLKADPQNRYFYEVILEGKPCKFYLDVEWEGQADPGKVVLHHLVDELLAYVKVRDGFFRMQQKENAVLNEISLEDFLSLLSRMCHLSIP